MQIPDFRVAAWKGASSVFSDKYFAETEKKKHLGTKKCFWEQQKWQTSLNECQSPNQLKTFACHFIDFPHEVTQFHSLGRQNSSLASETYTKSLGFI